MRPRVELNLIESALLNMFTPADVIYNCTGLKELLGKESMYDAALAKCAARTPGEVWRAIAENKRKRVEQLVHHGLRNNGTIPSKYELICNRSFCGKTRMAIAYWQLTRIQSLANNAPEESPEEEEMPADHAGAHR
jgi:hypothetical protein